MPEHPFDKWVNDQELAAEGPWRARIVGMMREAWNAALRAAVAGHQDQAVARADYDTKNAAIVRGKVTARLEALLVEEPQ